MSSGDLLDIQPSEVKFPYETKEHVPTYVLLTNNTAEFVAFKVEAAYAMWFSVRPKTGVLVPRATCVVTVTMQPQKKPCCDKVVVRNVIVPDGTNGKDITLMFNKMKGKIAEKFVKMRFYRDYTSVPTSVEKCIEKFPTAMDRSDYIRAVMFGSRIRGYLTASEDGNSVILSEKNMSQNAQKWVVEQFGRGAVLSDECQVWSSLNKVLRVAKEGQMVVHQMPLRVPDTPGWTIISCSSNPLVVLLRAELKGHKFFLGVNANGSLSLFEESSVARNDRSIQWTMKTVQIRFNQKQEAKQDRVVKDDRSKGCELGMNNQLDHTKSQKISFSSPTHQELSHKDGEVEKCGPSGVAEVGHSLSCNSGHNINISGTQNIEGASVYNADSITFIKEYNFYRL